MLKLGKLHFWKWNLLRRKRRRWAYSCFYFVRFRPGFHQNPRYLEEDEAFFYNKTKIVRRLTSRQRSGVTSQQYLRPRRFDSTIKGVPKLRFEPVSFLFLVFLSVKLRGVTKVYNCVETSFLRDHRRLLFHHR